MYELTIGLEIHIQQKTATKMFCRCSNDVEGKAPNTTVCPICMGHPGALPVINKEAIDLGARMALALNCTLPFHSKFDRKNYFYPDLPKGYQISQFDMPLGVEGYLDIEIPDSDEHRDHAHIRINRLHMEEDAAKLTHGGKDSLVDYNRGGTPLMEIVTEPDMHSPQEAGVFLHELRQIARYVGASDAEMEKGQLRCDANVSVQLERDGVKVSTPISEIKNLNSFKAVETALAYEAERLYQDFVSGGESSTRTSKITVGWDDARKETVMQRGKEEAHDYRYFPEPDLPPLHLTQDDIAGYQASLPELPQARRKRFVDEYGLSEQDARLLVEERETAEYFEKSASELSDWMKTKKLDEKNVSKGYKLLANWILNKLFALLSEHSISLSVCKITPENFAEFVTLFMEGAINSSAGQTVLEEMFATGAEPRHVVKEKGLEQVSDVDAIELVAQKVIHENTKVVEDYKGGKEQAIMYLVGQVMKEMKGAAQPQVVKDCLETILKD